MDGLAFHPYPDNSSQSPDFPHPNSTTIGLADYDKLVALLAEAFDGTAQQGSLAADPLRRVRDRVGRARREEEPLHRHRADDDEARRRAPAGGRLRPRPPARVLPADRRGHPPLPLPGRARARELAVGRLLRGRDAEGELLGRAGLARSRTRRLDRAVRRGRAGREARRTSASPGRASSSRASATSASAARTTARGSSSRRGRRRAHVAARVRGYGRYARPLVASLKGRKLGRAPVRLSLTVVHPVNPGVPFDARERRAAPRLASSSREAAPSR